MICELYWTAEPFNKEMECMKETAWNLICGEKYDTTEDYIEV